MRERIKEVVATTFQLSAADVPEDAVLGGLQKWDSLGHLELMLALEMEFGVRIPAESMLKLVSLHEIESYLTAGGVQ